MKLFRFFAVSLALCLSLSVGTSAQTTEFSYQGFVTDNNAPANGNYDLEFRLFNVVTGGTVLGTEILLNVPVTNGVVSVTLDFGDFSNADRFLEIGVKPAGGGPFTYLAPRSKVLSTPFATRVINAQHALSADNATNATFSQNAVNATNATNATNAATAQNALALGGVASTGFVRNQTTQQAASNFHVSGNGTAGGTLTGNIVSATTQFDLGSSRALAHVGQNNIFLGVLAGSVDGGIQNTMLGDSAGRLNTGNENVLAGFTAGQNSTAGSNNSFFGSRTGVANITGSNNTLLGYRAEVGPNNLTNAAAIGSRSIVESSNSLVLGSVDTKNGAFVDTNVGIGTTIPEATLDVAGQLPTSPPNTPNLRLTNYGRFALLRGRSARGSRIAPSAILDNDSLLIITADGHTGTGFSGLGQATIIFSATQNWAPVANGTAIKFNTTPNGSTAEATRMTINHDGNVGIGNTNPAHKLDVSGNVRIGTGSTGCVQDRSGSVIAGTCSSDLRFKRDIKPFGNTLHNFSRLRPVNFFWRADEFADKHFGTTQSFGLIAQEVEQAFPDLVGVDEQGYKVVNYSKLPLYTIQAVKELKAENDALKIQLQQQQVQIDELKRIVGVIQADEPKLVNKSTGTKVER